jgi:ABC-type lipoprotein export system ATPase subunit
LKSEQPTQPIALETAHLSRAVVGKVLTDDINVQVQIGEVVAVVGPSGSGKSSFLFHCHVVRHEDKDIMMTVEVRP